jgi:hypothetical protein
MERFNLTKINKMEGRDQHQVKISNLSATLDNLDDDMDITELGKQLG